MIPQSFIQDLLSRVDIVDVIESAVPLKKAGANLSACCPFHTEKSPSFTVSPAKQFYHCFGCGAHGTAISFLMEYHGLGFVEAVQDLAARVGMAVPDPEPRGGSGLPERAVGPELNDVLARAARYYKEQLKQSETAIHYLKGRGLTGAVAARFGLGFAPDGWQNLEAVFEDYADQRLVEAGLVIRNEEGRRYDRFRDRIMFPIVNPRGDIIGFGGRVLGQGEPKYLNSPETPVFEKGRELYGLFQARQAIRTAGRVLVVEGYMDVVALAQHGVEYAVATLGTATTPTHVQKLLRQTDHIVFAFDGDKAGRKAAWRALENSLQALTDGKHVGFLFLPDGEDPDSFVRAQGREAFEALVDSAEPLSAYLLRSMQAELDMTSAEGRASFLKAGEVLLKQVQAPNLSLALRDAMARAAGISLDRLEDQFGLRRPGPVRWRPDGTSRTPAARVPANRLREKIVLRCLVAQPELHPLCAEAALLAGHDGLWSVVATLTEGLAAGTLAASTPAMLQHLEDLGQAELAGMLQRELLEFGEAYDFGADLQTQLVKMRDDARRAASETALAGLASASEVTADMRALIPGVGAPDAGN